MPRSTNEKVMAGDAGSSYVSGVLRAAQAFLRWPRQLACQVGSETNEVVVTRVKIVELCNGVFIYKVSITQVYHGENRCLFLDVIRLHS